ncbi:MAG TPA: Hsp20/alpha crystallin family protein [Allosphingosinicella sp.]|nr:Hsp20/alpha crystallin family protein [Allosphingosinicella sp.]
MTKQDEIAVKASARGNLPAFTDQLIEPLSRLRNEVDRLFDDFPTRWPTFRFGRLAAAIPAPAVEMTETSKAFKLSVEVPGMDAGDIHVSVDNDMLVISGEKKEEREETEEGYLYSERTYGAFERRIELPAGADSLNVKAKVRKGVLQITLPKDQKAESNKRRITIEAD